MKPPRRAPARSFALPALWVLALACSEDEPTDPDVLLAEVTDCGAYELTPCDILEPGCQQRIAQIAACQWGGPGMPPLLPEVTTLTESDYRASLTEEATELADAAPLLAFNDVLVLLGLAEPEDVSVEAGVERSAEAITAFYDFSSKTISVVDHGQEQDLAAADATLFHELIHAQQDAAHDLGGLLDATEQTTDALTSVRTLFEGEAQFQQTLFEVGIQRVPIDMGSLRSGLSRLREATEAELFLGPSVLFSTLQFLPYTYGPEWMVRLWLDGGSAGIQSQYQRVPSDLLGVLRAAWGAATEKTSLTNFPLGNVFYAGAPPAEDSELIPVAVDRMGAWTVYVAARLAGDARLAEELALAWRGDQLDAYQLDAGGNAGRWRLSFDDEAHAAAFALSMSKNPSVTTRHDGRAVVCVVSQSGAKPEWLFGPLASW